MMHAVPDARLRLTHTSGTTTSVGYQLDADISPCDWRTIVASTGTNSVDLATPYRERITSLRFERGFDGIANTARRTHEGRLEFWFASTLSPNRLRGLFDDYPSPIHPDTLATSVLGDTQLKVTLGRVQEVAPCSRAHLLDIASTLAHQAAVAELIGAGVWTTTG